MTKWWALVVKVLFLNYYRLDSRLRGNDKQKERECQLEDKGTTERFSRIKYYCPSCIHYLSFPRRRESSPSPKTLLPHTIHTIPTHSSLNHQTSPIYYIIGWKSPQICCNIARIFSLSRHKLISNTQVTLYARDPLTTLSLTERVARGSWEGREREL